MGTTFLIQEISKFKKTNNFGDQDGFKHLPLPPIDRNPNLKIVYVLGDPILATVSLFRRNYHSFQAHKLQRFSKNKKVVHKNTTLYQYAKQQSDAFRFETHYDNWCYRYRRHPTLVIKYDHIHNSLGIMKEFLNLPELFVKNFPKRKERKSDRNRIDQTTYDLLNELYGNFGRKIEALPSSEVLLPSKFSFISVYTKSVYLRIILKEVFRRVQQHINLKSGKKNK